MHLHEDSSGHTPKGEIAGFKIYWSSATLAIAKVLSKAHVPIYTPTRSVQEFLFLLIIHGDSLRHFHPHQFTGWEMISRYGFSLTCPDTCEIEHHFLCIGPSSFLFCDLPIISSA